MRRAIAFVAAIASLLTSGQSWATEACAPRIVLEASESLSAQMEPALTNAGIEVGPSPECPSILASLQSDANGLKLTRRGLDGTEDSVLVTSTSFAALLLKSWARSDLSTIVASVHPAELVSAEGSSVQPVASIAADDASVATQAEPVIESSSSLPVELVAGPPTEGGHSTASRGLALGGAFEAGAALDGSIWLGAAAFGALPIELVDPLAPWFGIRASSSPAFQATESRTPVGRTSAELVLGVELPVRLGLFVLVPGVGAGVGWTRSARVNQEVQPCVVEGTCAWTLGPIVNDGFSTSELGFRTELRLRGELPVSDRFSLSAGVAATFSPFGAGEALLPAYAARLPANERSGLSLDPEPRLIFRGTVGLTWGGR